MTDGTDTTTEVEVTIKMLDHQSGEMVGVLGTTAKLTKADAGRTDGDKVEESIYISITPGDEPNYSDAVISVNTTGKLTKADAG